MSHVAFHVIGTPAPQGSKRHVGRGILVESSKKVAPWREAVKYAALPHRPIEPFTGPLHVSLVFTLARPKSAPKKRTAPDTRPDLDKLVRSTLDGIGEAGIWRDDAQVVSLNALKVWAPALYSLPVPGALVAVASQPSSADVNAAWVQALHELNAEPVA